MSVLEILFEERDSEEQRHECHPLKHMDIPRGERKYVKNSGKQAEEKGLNHVISLGPKFILEKHFVGKPFVGCEPR